MGLSFRVRAKLFLFIIILLGPLVQKSYANLPKKPIGFVAEVAGEVNKVGQGKDLFVKSPIFLGDRLETSLSALKAFFIDNTLIYMGPESFLSIDSFSSMESRSFFSLYKGVLRIGSYHQKTSSISLIRTSALNIEYKGSDFLIRVFPYKTFFRTQVIIFRGKVKLRLSNELGRRPYTLRQKESMVFYHNGSGNLLRKPMRGVIPNKAFRLLLSPRANGGKIFLYELASHFRKSSRRSFGRAPSSKRTLDPPFKKIAPKEESIIFSTQDLKEVDGVRKVDPLKASIKEMDRILEKDNYLKRFRPLN